MTSYIHSSTRACINDDLVNEILESINLRHLPSYWRFCRDGRGHKMPSNVVVSLFLPESAETVSYVVVTQASTVYLVNIIYAADVALVNQAQAAFEGVE